MIKIMKKEVQHGSDSKLDQPYSIIYTGHTMEQCTGDSDYQCIDLLYIDLDSGYAGLDIA